MALERLDPALEKTIFTLDHYARYLFAASLARGRRVLDIACGYGYGSFLQAEAGAREVIGIDVSGDALTYARKHYLHEQVTYHQGNITAIEPSVFGLFDLIISFETLEHVDNPVQSIKALSRMLTPSGVLLVSVPNDLFHNIENPFHRTKFTESELINLLQEHFTHINSYYQNYAASSIVWRVGDPALQLSSSHQHLLRLEPNLFGRIDGGDNAQAADCFIALCGKVSLQPIDAVVVQSSEIWREHSSMLIADRDRLWREVQLWHGEAQATQVQLISVTADRDRLWQEVQVWHGEAQTMHANLQEMTADRDRLWQEVQMWYSEAQTAQTQHAELGDEKQKTELQLITVQSKCDLLQQEIEHLSTQLGLVQKEFAPFKDSRLHHRVERIRTSVVYRASRAAAFPLYQRARKAVRSTIVERSPSIALPSNVDNIDVKIRATGEHNAASKGSEIWLLDVVNNQEKPVSWREIPANETWQWLPNERSSQGDGLVATGAASLRLKLPANSMLRLLSHPWSGIITIDVAGVSQETDLYSPIPEVKTVRIPSSDATTRTSFESSGILAPRQQYDESMRRWVETIQRERPAAVAVMHPDWRGVRSASENLFSYRYYQEDTLDDDSARQKARMLADAGVERVVLCGFPYTYRHLVRAIKKETPSTQVYVFWLSNFLQSNEDYSWTIFKQIDQLCRQGLITRWGFAKQGMAEIVGRTGVPTGFLASCVRMIPDVPSTLQPDGPHLGIWTIEPIWRKLPYAMIAASAVIPQATVHITGQNERATEFARFFQLRTVVNTKPLPQTQMSRALARMHLNLYVTLSECSPMLPLESLAAGVPCLLGPTSHLFEDNAYLHSRLVVPYPDRAFVIAKYIEQALAERDQIIHAYREYAPGYNARAHQSVHDFLGLDSNNTQPL